MGSNWFSDLLNPISNYIESIPLVGPIVKGIDKFAANTDPSHLGTAAVGKLIGGDFEDQYTSEEARKGASHTVGLAALAAYLSGASAAGGTGASTVPEGAAGYGNAATYGVTEAAGGTLSSGAGGGSAGAATLFGSSAVPEGAAGYGTASTYGVTPAAGGVVEKSTVGKLLSNKLFMKYLSSLGQDLAKYGSNTNQGMQFSNTNAVTNNEIRERSYTKLMGQLLGGEDEQVDLTGEKSSLGKSTMLKTLLSNRTW